MIYKDLSSVIKEAQPRQGHNLASDCVELSNKHHQDKHDPTFKNIVL